MIPQLRPHLEGSGIDTVDAVADLPVILEEPAAQLLGVSSKLCSLATSPPADLPASGVTG